MVQRLRDNIKTWLASSDIKDKKAMQDAKKLIEMVCCLYGLCCSASEWWGAGGCLEPGADLHTAQLMPLPLTVSCFSKIQTCFTFLVPADTGSPGQRAVKWVCLCCSAFSIQSMNCWRHYVFDMSVCACVCTCMPVESFPDQLIV